MEDLKAGRQDTERARARVMDALAKRNKKLDARRELLEAKRIEMAGGKEALEEIRRAHAAETFLDSLGMHV